MSAHYSEGDFVDPQAPATFEQCKLDWSKASLSPHAEVLRLYRDLISLRKQHPGLGNCRKDFTEIQFDEHVKTLSIKRADSSGTTALVVCNLSPEPQSISIPNGTQGCCLALWTGDSFYGGGVGQYPAESLNRGSQVSLAGFEGAIYLSQGSTTQH